MPLWDRFDMCIKTDEIGYEQIRCSSDNGNVPDSESMKQAVMRARLAQLKRFNGMNIKYNSQMSTGDMKRFCRLGEEEEITLEMMTENLWEDAYETKKDPCRGYVGFYPELPGCIGYGKDKEMLRENMKESLEKWVRAGYEQWRERWIMGGCEKL